jgi:2-hydroxychromene-2-carboxylate isomerase
MLIDMAGNIEFLFDFSSPNCYVAFHRLRQLSDLLGAEVRLVPIFLGGIFKATGDSVMPRDSLEFKYMVRIWSGTPTTFGFHSCFQTHFQ